METFSALLALCAGNSPVTGEFPTQRPVTRSFDVFFVPRLNKRLSKQSWGWWFETPSCPLWRHCNATTEHNQTQILCAILVKAIYSGGSKRYHNTWYGTVSTSLAFCDGKFWPFVKVTRRFPLTKGQWCVTLMFSLFFTWQAVTQTVDAPVICDTMTLPWRHSNDWCIFCIGIRVLYRSCWTNSTTQLAS